MYFFKQQGLYSHVSGGKGANCCNLLQFVLLIFIIPVANDIVCKWLKKSHINSDKLQYRHSLLFGWETYRKSCWLGKWDCVVQNANINADLLNLWEPRRMNSNTGYWRFYAGKKKCLWLEISSWGIKECGGRITDLVQENRLRLRKTKIKRDLARGWNALNPCK